LKIIATPSTKLLIPKVFSHMVDQMLCYRVRAMDVNTALDDFDTMIASHGSGLLANV